MPFMFDRELAKEILRQILAAANRIGRRFKGVRSSDDFLLSDAGIDKLDAICMMLIVIGENLKNLDKVTGGKLLAQYPEVDWKGAKGMRDIISHHYNIVPKTLKRNMSLKQIISKRYGRFNKSY